MNALIHFVTPGEILKEEYLQPLGLSVAVAAAGCGVPRTRLNDIIRGRRAITPDTALRLARYLGTDAKSWLALQSNYDLAVAERDAGSRLADVHRFAA